MAHLGRLVRALFNTLPVVSLGIAAMLVAGLPRAEAITLPPNFQETIVVPGAQNGLQWPVGLAFLPDRRILIIQQSGQIRLVANGALVANALLTMPEVEFNGERGLLGIAVDPDFPARPYIYVFYSDNSTAFSHLARYTVAGDLSNPTSTNLTISSASKVLLINQIPDNASNHNGGTLRFGVGKTLYLSLGDDAVSCAAQDLTQLKGKILRIKVDDSITPLDLSTMVPSGNPFASSPNVNTRAHLGVRAAQSVSGSRSIRSRASCSSAMSGESAREEAGPREHQRRRQFRMAVHRGHAPLASTATATATPRSDRSRSSDPRVPAYQRVAYAVIGGPVYEAPPGAGSERFPPNYQGVYFVSDYYSRFLYAVRFNCMTGGWDKIPGATTEFWATDLAGGVADIVVWARTAPSTTSPRHPRRAAPGASARSATPVLNPGRTRPSPCRLAGCSTRAFPAGEERCPRTPAGRSVWPDPVSPRAERTACGVPSDGHRGVREHRRGHPLGHRRLPHRSSRSAGRPRWRAR